MTQRRNDPHHFPAVNGSGHRRRKVINVPPELRFHRLDQYEQRTRDLITDVFNEFEEVLMADAERRSRAAVQHLDDWWHQQGNPRRRGGDPGE